MTVNKLIRYLLYFIGLFLLQNVVFDPLNLGRFATPVVYVLFVILLPANITPWISLVICFVAGLIAGIFSDSSGIHASAMVATAFVRHYILPLFIGKDGMEKGIEPNLVTMGYRLFFFYSLSLSFIYLLVFTFLDAATFHHFFNTLGTIIASTLLTVLLIYLIELFLYRVQNNQNYGS